MLQAIANSENKVTYKWGFAENITGGVDPVYASIIQKSTGMTVDQTGGNLIITTGVNAYEETIIRSKQSFVFDGIFRYGLTLSQRIVNQNFVFELVDLYGDNLPITITSAVSVSVKKRMHGFSIADIGKGIWIGAISVGSCLTQRAIIASITDDDTFVLTVSGFPASGDGTCSLFGMNYHQVIYNGISSTSAGGGYSTARKGWANTLTSSTINSTATGHIGIIESVDFNESVFGDIAYGVTTQTWTPRSSMNQNVPEGVELFIQIRVFNGSTAPASSTTATFAFVDAELFKTSCTRISGVDSLSGRNMLPVNIGTITTTSAMTVAGAAAHSAAVSGSPVRIGGKVVTAADITLVASDTSDLFMTTGGAAVVKQYSPPETDWQYSAQASGILNTTTAVTFKAAAGASIRNYITSIQVMAEALGAATELAIRDGAAGAVIWRTKIPTSGLPTTQFNFPTPLKGTANTLLEVVTLTASVTGAVYFSAQGYNAA